MKHALVCLAVFLAVSLGLGGTRDTLRASEDEHLQGEAQHDEDHHGDEHAHEGADKKYSGKIGEYEIVVMQHGDITPQGQAHFDIVLSSHPTAPKAIRIWIGDGSAKGSVKSRAGKGHSPGQYHALVEVPDELPKESKLWIEIQGSDAKQKGAFELK